MPCSACHPSTNATTLCVCLPSAVRNSWGTWGDGERVSKGRVDDGGQGYMPCSRWTLRPHYLTRIVPVSSLCRRIHQSADDQ